jgi:tyramine---L-glutamate ligase
VKRIFVYEFVTAQAAQEPGSWAVSLVEEGRAMLDAIVRDLKQIPDIEVQVVDDAFFPTSPNSDQESVLVIAPEFDGILENFAKKVIDSGRNLLGPMPEAISLTADKLRLQSHLHVRRIPTPECWEWGKEPSDLYPKVWKPRFGAGSQATFLVPSSVQEKEYREEIQRENAGEMIAQRYVPGQAASIAFLIGPQDIVPLQPAFQHLSTEGRFHYLGGSLPISKSDAQRIIQIAEPAIRSVPGLQGYVGVDVVLGDQDWVIEINPRLTTSYVGLRGLAKSNLAKIMLDLLDGYATPPIEWAEGRIAFASNGTIL